jgi:hypothetical protein
MSGVDHPGSPRRRRWRIVALVTLLLAVVTSPVTLAALAFWAANGSWEFAGGGFRHWVFIKGSTVDRLAFVAATGEPARYVVRPAEGTDPGAIFAVYDSGAMPGDVVVAYAQRCRALGIGVNKQVVAADAAEARLVCEGDPAVASADDIWVIATRPAGTSSTQVRITAGPGLTLTYNF